MFESMGARTDVWTTAPLLYYKLTLSAFGSSELKKKEKESTHTCTIWLHLSSFKLL